MFERHFVDISKFDRAGFLKFALVFVSRDFELGQNLSGDFRKSLTHLLFLVIWVCLSDILLTYLNLIGPDF